MRIGSEELGGDNAEHSGVHRSVICTRNAKNSTLNRSQIDLSCVGRREMEGGWEGKREEEGWKEEERGDRG